MLTDYPELNKFFHLSNTTRKQYHSKIRLGMTVTIYVRGEIKFVSDNHVILNIPINADSYNNIIRICDIIHNNKLFHGESVTIHGERYFAIVDIITMCESCGFYAKIFPNPDNTDGLQFCVHDITAVSITSIENYIQRLTDNFHQYEQRLDTIKIAYYIKSQQDLMVRVGPINSFLSRSNDNKESLYIRIHVGNKHTNRYYEVYSNEGSINSFINSYVLSDVLPLDMIETVSTKACR